MPVAAWFRLWLFPPAPAHDTRLTYAPALDEGITPMVTNEDIPPDRRAILLDVQQRQHEILNRLTSLRLRRDLAERRQSEPPEPPA